ncbi:hypothetical protein DERF_005652 [Dermatophagoides farinae]|uniref:Uncharacterized protein n=1 Tax=Dermatophagoides farinae TaxID=6954 RepID=A0A922I9X5_DERFA|nr:hypothetical protein DERF_005652 [Dermatophagoides farinae]
MFPWTRNTIAMMQHRNVSCREYGVQFLTKKKNTLIRHVDSIMKMKKKKKMNLLKLPPSSTKRNDRMNNTKGKAKKKEKKSDNHR